MKPIAVHLKDCRCTKCQDKRKLRSEAGEMGIELAKLIWPNRIISAQEIDERAQAILSKLAERG